MSNHVLGFNSTPTIPRGSFGSFAVSRVAIVSMILVATLTGCQASDPSSRIIFLDGASHFGSATKVKSGLRRAGYSGEFEGFVWTSFLGWGVDHLVQANSEGVAIRLANRIREVRAEYPDGYLALMSLSAGSAVILGALEHLPEGVTVDDVVLFQPSVASDRELTRALEHVRRRMIATHCRWDGILAALAISADQHLAKPAGQIGFQSPRPMTVKQRRQYIKLLSIPWQKRYASAGWGGINGWHVSSTSPGFVKRYIAPYVLTSVRHAKSRAMRDRLDAREADWQASDDPYQRQPESAPSNAYANPGDVDGSSREPFEAPDANTNSVPETDPRDQRPDPWRADPQSQPPPGDQQPRRERPVRRYQSDGDRQNPQPPSNPTAPTDTPDRDEPARERPPTRPES